MTKTCSKCGCDWLDEFVSKLMLLPPDECDINNADSIDICEDCRGKLWEDYFAVSHISKEGQLLESRK